MKEYNNRSGSLDRWRFTGPGTFQFLRRSGPEHTGDQDFPNTR
jgi:hypothetical protein